MTTEHTPTLKYTVNVGPTKGLIVEDDGSTYLELINRLHDSRFEAKLRNIITKLNAHDALVKALESVLAYEGEPVDNAGSNIHETARAALRLAKGGINHDD